MTHIMVDLETLGLTPGSVIRSIGACVFDPISGRIGATFYRNIDRASCEAFGLTVNPETEAWWAKPENAEAQSHLAHDQVPLGAALADFSVWWTEQEGEEFWANDPNFDETLLVAAYIAVGLKQPWSYRAPRSCRTIYALSGVAPNRDVGIAHNALVDAKNQAVAVSAAYAVLDLAGAPDKPEGGLSLDSYQARTADTAIYPGKGTPLGLIYCGLKLAGEGGEVAEKIGKAIRDDGLVEHVAGMPGIGQTQVYETYDLTPERREALKGELGDVLWYVASAARELGYDLSEVAQANLDKLADRAARGVLGGSGDAR
jgi:NTP pyrophosphatase (non-canonical NTP hydrolase)